METILESPQLSDDFVMDYDDFGDRFGEEAAHFFEDPLSTRGRPDIRSHLEDLAQRHPEFADQLRYPAWTADEPAKTNTWGRKRRGSEETEDTSKQQNKEENSDSLRGRAKDNLRNTVPDMGQKQQQAEEKESRGQRSWSAPPPDNRNEKPRFVSKIEIHPVNPDAKPQPQTQPQQSSSTGDATKPPMAPPKPQPQPQSSQQPQHKTSTVRHIPIFVEGRDEPLLPKVEPEFTQQAAPQQHYPPQSHFQQPSRKQTPPRFEHNPTQYEQQVPVQTRFEKEVPIQTRFEKEVPVQSRHKEVPVQRFEKEVPTQTRYEQQQPQQQQTQPEPQPPPTNPNDPLYRVECVQKEVEELKSKIDNFQGTSRKDKEYILIDELLTRNLIKLDNIETEGRDEVRAARKNLVKCIEKYISVLENKVPLPGQNLEKQIEGEIKEEKLEAMETEQLSQAAENMGGDGQQKTEPEQIGDKPMEIEHGKGEAAQVVTDSPSGNEQPLTEEKKEASSEIVSSSNEAESNSA